MPNPLSIAWDTFAGLPDAIKSGGPVAVILAFVLFAGFQGWWVFGATYKEVESQRDEFKAIAFNCTGIVTTAAQKSAKINDQAVESGKPTVAAVKVVAPLTDTEKKAIEKPKSAEAPDLAQKIEAAQKVLQKTDVVPVPSPAKKP